MKRTPKRFLISVLLCAAAALGTTGCGEEEGGDTTPDATVDATSTTDATSATDATSTTDATSETDATSTTDATSEDTAEGPVHGCSLADAEDRTGEATVELVWGNPHNACVKITAGATVTWTGNFSSHPLVGGVSPATDDASPITGSDQSGSVASVTFSDTGDFPYFCDIHTASMQGVIYVVDEGTLPDGSIHGCKPEDAEDRTSEDPVELAWGNPHNACVKVTTGATVTWTGNFSSHPLVGGVSPTTDDASPITSSDQSGASASVTLSDSGDYPYFCDIHTGTMQGVVYAVDEGTLPEAEVHGCTSGAAEDMTGLDPVFLEWSNPHNACIAITEGATVFWTGNFTSHPLVGGVSPTTDNASPVTGSDQSGASAAVTFSEQGDFPYFCDVHTGAMQGVVYVKSGTIDPVHGCTWATADDRTGDDPVELAWGNPHSACLRISAGATVTWTGNFTSHPLVGGVSPVTDDTSPITSSDQSGASASVAFSERGMFPYFCDIHTGGMQGVIFVE